MSVPRKLRIVVLSGGGFCPLFSFGKIFEKNQKTLKKGIDKGGSKWYNIKAAAKKGSPSQEVERQIRKYLLNSPKVSSVLEN